MYLISLLLSKSQRTRKMHQNVDHHKYVGKIKSLMGILAAGPKSIDIGPENTCF